MQARASGWGNTCFQLEHRGIIACEKVLSAGRRSRSVLPGHQHCAFEMVTTWSRFRPRERQKRQLTSKPGPRMIIIGTVRLTGFWSYRRRVGEAEASYGQASWKGPPRNHRSAKGFLLEPNASTSKRFTTLVEAEECSVYQRPNFALERTSASSSASILSRPKPLSSRR